MTRTKLAGLPRRRVLVYSGTAAFAACAPLGCGGNAIERLSEDVEINLADYPSLDRVGQTVTIEVDQLSLPLAVTRQDDQATFIVTGTECNHRGCGVVRDGAGWKCPCHGAKFELDGELREGPATKDLGQYDYEVADGVLTIFGEA